MTFILIKSVIHPNKLQFLSKSIVFQRLLRAFLKIFCNYWVLLIRLFGKVRTLFSTCNGLIKVFLFFCIHQITIVFSIFWHFCLLWYHFLLILLILLFYFLWIPPIYYGFRILITLFNLIFLIIFIIR